MYNKNLSDNKIKKFFYIIFILVWIVSTYFKGYYSTTSIYTSITEFDYFSDISLTNFYCTIAIFCFLSLISVRYFKTVLFFSSIIISIISLGDALYGRYYFLPLSISLLDQISFLGSIGESIFSLLVYEDFYLFIDIPILLLLLLYLKSYSFGIKYKYRLIFSFIFLFIYCNFVYRFYSKYYTEEYVYNRRVIGEDLGVFYYHFEDIKIYSKNKLSHFTTPNDFELDRIINGNQAPNQMDNQYTGILKDKNVIIIQLEAFQNFVINQEFNGIEVTPVLNNLIKENSIYASNFYYETAGGNTVDAELLTNTSLLPTFNGSPYYLYPFNTYISMPQVFSDKGYSVNSFHAYDKNFWNRETMHKTLGYDKFYSINDFEFDEDDMLGWSLCDEIFLKDSLDKTIAASDGGNFYSYMITLSSHYPYEGFYNGNYTWMLGRTKGSVPVFERYLNALQYADFAVGELIEYLKEKGLYEDTVLVILGDHGGLFIDEKIDMTDVLNLKPTDEQFAKLETVPLIIHNPDIKNGIITEKVSGQKDLMATLLNLMDIKVNYTLGNDILSDNYEGVAIKRYGNIYTNDFIYLKEKDCYYDYDTLVNITNNNLIEEYSKIVSNYYKIISASDFVYNYDYLRNYRED